MPVEWKQRIEKAPAVPGAFSHADGHPPACEVHIWPNRSLPARGFVLFIALTGGLFALPLVALLGTPALWGILPFFGLALWGVWYALQRNTRDGRILERLTLWSDRIHIARHTPDSAPLEWSANPFWVRLDLHAEGGPVPNYLTLTGGGRSVELGAFLSPDERARLHDDLDLALRRLRR